MLFEVPIVYRGQVNYLVDADNKKDAEYVARCKWEAGEKPDDLGNEWEEIERFGQIVLMRKEKMKYNRAYYQKQLDEQLKWIEECGGTLEGYIEEYIEGAKAIFDADIQERERIERLLNSCRD